MIFSNETAWNQLVKHGAVHTFRAQAREVPSMVWLRRRRTGPKVGEARITQRWTVITADPKYLEPYADASGFVTAGDWYDVIHRMHDDVSYRGFVHRVELSWRDGRTCIL
jgi:hypothetical protein